VPTRRQFLVAGAGAAAAASLAGCPPAARSERPNVLLIVADTLRVDHVYGDGARTPAIDALAREGLSFDRAFPEAMPTVPARNSILAGRRMFPFRGWRDRPGLLAKPGWAPVPDVENLFTSVLRRAGYWTAYITDNPFLGFAGPYGPLRWSFDEFARKAGQIGGASGPVAREALERWLHPATSDRRTTRRLRRFIANADYADDEKRSFAAGVFGAAMEALDRARRRQPFLLVVDTYQPHEPWTPPGQYLELNGYRVAVGAEPAMPRYGRVENWLESEEAGPVLERMRALYTAELSMTDRWLGLLMERLRDHRLERKTVVVLVSDHGFQFGERGWTGKISVALHPELIQVPLVVVDPRGWRAGERTSYFASTHDLGPTILAMADVRRAPTMSGVDLSRLFEGRSPPTRGYTYGGYSNSHFLRSERWAYMSDNRLESPRLFDLNHDPGELTNVAARHPDVVAELADTVLRHAGDPLPFYES
jgi:arylsulfatase A-like enzyme